MTPYEKALQLKESFNDALTTRDCAIVCVDEIMEALSDRSWQNRNELMFYLEVKQILQEL
jgi:hypothetical protein